jgi:hypothetical protein
MLQSRNDLPDVRTAIDERRLRFLTMEQIRQVDRALAELGPCAEVRLIKAKGRLRFIQTVDSESIAEPQPT